MNNSLLLHGATIVTANGEINDGSVFIENGRIAQISEGNVPRAGQMLDLSDTRLMPGFIDVHNHGAVGVDCNAADADALFAVSEFLAKNGVTGWLPTFVPDSDENYQKGIRAIDELIRTQTEREPAARVLGVHYEGPFVSEKQCGALRVEYFKDFGRGDEIGSLPRLKSANAAHLITVAPEIAGGVELISELNRRRWIVSIGHTRAALEILDAACAAGARHLTHFFNAMTGLHHREVGVAGWGLTKEEMTFDIIGDGVHVHPEILRFACRTKTPQKVLLISDSVAPTGLGDGEFSIWDEKISVTNGRTQNARGSIAGSVITVLDAVNNLIDLGFSPLEIAQMASANPAKLLGISEECGTIEIGKRADLTALNEQGEVVLTIIGGKIAYQK